jgi:hypothetical protein
MQKYLNGNKLGASPKLECWNIGNMGFGILEYWFNGNSRLYNKIKNGPYPLKNQYSIIPLFHYSMNEA